MSARGEGAGRTSRSGVRPRSRPSLCPRPRARPHRLHGIGARLRRAIARPYPYVSALRGYDATCVPRIPTHFVGTHPTGGGGAASRSQERPRGAKAKAGRGGGIACPNGLPGLQVERDREARSLDELEGKLPGLEAHVYEHGRRRDEVGQHEVTEHGRDACVTFGTKRQSLLPGGTPASATDPSGLQGGNGCRPSRHSGSAPLGSPLRADVSVCPS